MGLLGAVVGGSIGGVLGVFSGTEIGKLIYTGPHKYGIVVTTFVGGVVGVTVGLYIGGVSLPIWPTILFCKII